VPLPKDTTSELAGLISTVHTILWSMLEHQAWKLWVPIIKCFGRFRRSWIRGGIMETLSML